MLFEDDEGNILIWEEFSVLPDRYKNKFRKVTFRDFCLGCSETV